ncbi:DNA-binding LacI/PurR family transcriptional regulator [Phycicoccus badiiscoriae]|uniref:DNA-binding LacI/PurR family transcriptional regulator n=1 Tax=Pedococcus badiiscoriae TaxID=642776 RepID=A0A852WGS0_9MICO|nr:substrate-binding domain-containing protein [Pedococcus badiiscoriae]NYG08020.1 DNA-binding LacI/PurR family transcriptional regulator [Pedococcus badiiscoriae]
MSRPRQLRPTLRAVAQAAGVSTSTASLAFSGRGPVAPETVARVRAAAEQLGYAGPDPLASSLRQGRSGVVGVVVEGRLLHAFRDPFAVSVLDGLSQVLDDIPAGMLLIAQPAGTPERAITQLSATALDAVVFSLCGPDKNPAVDHLAARGIPMLGDGSPVDPRVAHVALDNRGATVALGRHLTELGHRRVAHLMMPLRHDSPTGLATLDDVAAAEFTDTRDRARGFLDVFGADDLGAELEVGAAPRLAQTAIPDVEQGAIAARLLLDLPEDQRPTAIVAQSDLLAMGVVRAADDLGLSVPGDLSVTGFDGVELPWFAGTLTTIDQHGLAKGRLMGEMLRQLLDGQRPDDVVQPTHLRIGTTTAPPVVA